MDTGQEGIGMTDLFGGLPAPAPRAKVGEGNAKFIGHRVNGMSLDEIKRNLRDGVYPNLHPAYLREAGIGA